MVHLHTMGALRLHDSAGVTHSAVIVQPKRVALLVYLAVAGAHDFVRRDQVLLVFWPDDSQAHARNALRQAVHHLRMHLGAGVIVSRGTEEIGVDPAQLWCDCREFDEACDDARHVSALALYRGAFLDGFHFAGASHEFDRWVNVERERRARQAMAAALHCADADERRGDLAGAARWADLALRYSTGEEHVLRRAIDLLDRSGDRASALRLYSAFARRLHHELDAAPSTATRLLVARIRGDRPDDAPRHAPPDPAPE